MFQKHFQDNTTHIHYHYIHTMATKQQLKQNSHLLHRDVIADVTLAVVEPALRVRAVVVGLVQRLLDVAGRAAAPALWEREGMILIKMSIIVDVSVLSKLIHKQHVY